MRRRPVEEEEPDVGAVPEQLMRFEASEWTDADGELLLSQQARVAFRRAWQEWAERAGMDVLDVVMWGGAAGRHTLDPSWPMPTPGMTPHITTVRRSEWTGPMCNHPWEWS